MLAGRLQLDPRALGERLRPEAGEEVVGGAQLLARVHAPAFASQPLAVEQVGAGEVDRHARSSEPLGRLYVEVLGVLAVEEERPRAGRDPERPVRAARGGRVDETPEGIVGQVGRAGPDGGLDRARPWPSSRRRGRADPRWREARRPGRPRSGRGRCRGPPRPNRARRGRRLRRDASAPRGCAR